MSFFTSSTRLAPQGQPTTDEPATEGSQERPLSKGEGVHPGDRPDNPEAPSEVSQPVAPRAARTAWSWTLTALACALVLFALITPNKLSLLKPGAFVRLPVEALLGAALVLVLPARLRRVAATLIGVGLGLLTIVKVADMGFYAVLDRPFDLVLDWTFLGNGLDFLTESYGRVAAIGAMVGATVLVVGLLALMTFSALRLTRLLVGHRRSATGSVAVLGIVWVICAVLGTHLVPGKPFASRSAAALVYRDAHQVGKGLRDHQEFATQLKVDAFANTPSDQLLTGLRGKDVILTFVESYGRSALEDPGLSVGVDAVLDSGTSQLSAAGFASESAWLTSPTTGGGSWLAHGTLLSGVWTNNQQRHRTLEQSNRLTLTRAFQSANWRTVAVMPNNLKPWPEGAFYGFDKIYASHSFGYHGPRFGWATTPDQFSLETFQKRELANPNRKPVMAQVVLVSSHAPWSTIPSLVDWNALGDGSIFNSMPSGNKRPKELVSDQAKVRSQYALSIEYSLNSVISFLKTYGNKNTVLIFLGDHQPVPAVTGAGASRDVPITIVAKDPAVLKRISGWNWQAGLKPGAQAPVWRMDAFRDRFLTAFGAPGSQKQVAP